MRAIPALIAAVLAATAGAFLLLRSPERNDDLVRVEVCAARDAIWRAWFGNDRPVLERMLPEHFAGLGWGGGLFDSRESVLQGSAGFAASGGRLRRPAFRDDRVQVFGDVATVFSTCLVEFEAGRQTTSKTGRATAVFVRRHGGWTNPAWHLDPGG